MQDIPINDAMLCWTRGDSVKVVLHPDKRGESGAYRSSVGACFTDWRKKDLRGQKLQLMIDAWHVTAFSDIPSERVHEALLVIPEYRDMLADDCLPKQFQHERD